MRSLKLILLSLISINLIASNLKNIDYDNTSLKACKQYTKNARYGEIDYVEECYVIFKDKSIEKQIKVYNTDYKETIIFIEDINKSDFENNYLNIYKKVSFEK